MTTSEKAGDDSTKRKRPEANLRPLRSPSLFVLLEDPHDDGPQEYEDTTYGEYL
jgi:hypothetical protein